MRNAAADSAPNDSALHMTHSPPTENDALLLLPDPRPVRVTAPLLTSVHTTHRVVWAAVATGR
jgi:hypothetical protein